MHYYNLVLTDGGGVEIGKLVKSCSSALVWTYNEYSKKFETKPILNGRLVGKVRQDKELRHILTVANCIGGRFGFGILSNQLVMANNGWKAAKDLLPGDRVLTKYESSVNGTLRDFLYGTFVGDCTLTANNNSTAQMRFQDSSNPVYLNWKVKMLSPFYSFRRCGDRYDSNFSYELFDIKKRFVKRSPLEMLNNFSYLSLAIWMMDDGHFDSENSHCRYVLSLKRFRGDKVMLGKIHSRLNSLGLPNRFNLNDGSFSFDKPTSLKIAHKICKYIPKSMQYKLPLDYRGQYQEFFLTNDPEIKSTYVEVVANRIASAKQMRSRNIYEISVLDSDNILMGGIHNGVVVKSGVTIKNLNNFMITEPKNEEDGEVIIDW